MIRKHTLSFCLGALLLASCNSAVTQKDALLNNRNATIFYNGDILTMEGDSARYAEAVVQQDGRIVFVGSRAEAFKKYESEAQKVNLEGKTMLPGFVDGHGHFYNTGFVSMLANLLPAPDGGCNDVESIVRTMDEWRNSEDGKYITNGFGWLLGHGYDDSQLKEKDHPTSKDLDRLSTEIPIVVIHQSEHLGVLNSKALELAGYTKDSKDPEGGHIRRYPDGTPNGVVEENALFNVLFPLLGKTSEEVAVHSIQKAQEINASYGFTTVQDGRSTPEQMVMFRNAAAKNLFYLDVNAYPDIDVSGFAMDTAYFSKNYKNHYRVAGVKLVLDGAPQGKTAWLTQCYHVNPAGKTGCYTGSPTMPDAKANAYIEQAFKNKWQMICHVNGDAAISQYLNAIEKAQARWNYPDHRTTIIHGQTLRKDQIPVVKKLGVYCSLFPMHTFYWGDWHRESVLGEQRAEYISPCRDVIDAGINLTSHHDAPVVFPKSMRILDATVNRVTRTGYILGPDQRVTPYEGLKTLTIWGAKQYFEEDTKGSIKEGKVADFVILDKNPLKIDPLQINGIQIQETIKDGKLVYSKAKGWKKS